MTRALFAAVAALAMVLQPASPAAAAEVPEVGWWWAGRPSPTFPATVAPAPAVPDGGLYVGSGPGGDTGIAALRVPWPAGTENPVLNLVVADAIGTPAVDACPAGSDWEPVEGGSWDQRPSPDCEGTWATGTASEDGTEISFDLSSFRADDGVLDVIVVPTSDPTAPAAPTFSVAFEAPTADTFVFEPIFDDGADDGSDNGSDAGGNGDGGGAPANSGGTAGPIFDATFPTQPQPAQDGSTVAPNPVAPGPAGPFKAQPAGALPYPPDVFPYSSVLTLGLLVLALGSYMARSLSRPVAVRPAGRTRT